MGQGKTEDTEAPYRGVWREEGGRSTVQEGDRLALRQIRNSSGEAEINKKDI